VCSSDLEYILPVPSEGFAYDFALCRLLLHLLGFNDNTAIAQRLSQWKSLPLRGQIWRHRKKNQTFFVDCYNADVPALLESAHIFLRKFPHGPHFYILSGFSEYGEESEKQHRLAGECFPLIGEGEFFLIGNECLPLAEALWRRGIKRGQIHILEQRDDVRQIIDQREGNFYLKGSRCYALEKLIDFTECDFLEI
jgi:UDP-N-acetylmuramyl pentapeptide synthase